MNGTHNMYVNLRITAAAIMLCCMGATICHARTCGLGDGSPVYGLERTELLLAEAAKENLDGTEGKRYTGNRIVSNVYPQKTEEIPLYQALAVDFFVPGGGSLYYNNYYWGAAFGVLKCAGAWVVYHYYRKWEYRRSLYRSAKKANEMIDPYHDLQFRVPGEGYKTVDELKRDYDRSAQNITFAVIANVLVYVVSLYTTYVFVKRHNENSIPTFEIGAWKEGADAETGYAVRLSITHRM